MFIKEIFFKKQNGGKTEGGGGQLNILQKLKTVNWGCVLCLVWAIMQV